MPPTHTMRLYHSHKPSAAEPKTPDKELTSSQQLYSTITLSRQLSLPNDDAIALITSGQPSPTPSFSNDQLSSLHQHTSNHQPPSRDVSIETPLLRDSASLTSVRRPSAIPSNITVSESPNQQSRTTAAHRFFSRKQSPNPQIISKTKWPLGILVHTVPITAALVIIAINFQGYFIGAQFTGVTNPTSQSIVLALLQVTAKFFEIIVIGSLGFVVLDIVHHFLFFDEAGLPLGLTGIRLMFSNVFYLLSPTFWSSIRAFRSRKIQFFVCFLLLGVGLIATFIGPAAAVLLIPSVRTHWLAGKLLYQAPSTLIWTSRLNASSINSGDPGLCKDRSEMIVSYPSSKYAGCTWAATNSLSSVVLSDIPPWSGNLTVHDGYYGRDVSWSTYNRQKDLPTVWAWSSMTLTNTIGSTLLSSWSQTVNKTDSLSSQYNRYSQRDPSGTQTKLQGMLAPVARTYCNSVESQFNETAYSFPITPVNGIWQDRGSSIEIPATLIHNTSTARSFWLTNTTNLNITNPPSAVLIAQIPGNLTNPDDFTGGVVMACSAYAYWTNANQSTVLFDEGLFSGTGNDPVTFTDIGDAFDSQGRPQDSLFLSRIDFDHQWLSLLTPTFGLTSWMHDPTYTNTTGLSSGYTSLSKILDSFDSGYQTWRMQLLLSLLVVDGIARSNTVTGGIAADSTVQGLWNAWMNDLTFNPISLLVSGGNPPILQSTSSLERSAFLWTVTISGYAYAVDSLPCILAVVVLASYVLVALCHVGFTLYKRWYSEVWWSAPNMIALAHRSPPSVLWENQEIAGGMGTSSFNKLFVKLRATDVFGKETVHLFVDDHGTLEKDYHKLEKGGKYH